MNLPPTSSCASVLIEHKCVVTAGTTGWFNLSLGFGSVIDICPTLWGNEMDPGLSSWKVFLIVC